MRANKQVLEITKRNDIQKSLVLQAEKIIAEKGMASVPHPTYNMRQSVVGETATAYASNVFKDLQMHQAIEFGKSYLRDLPTWNVT